MIKNDNDNKEKVKLLKLMIVKTLIIAVNESASLLEAAGFKELKECDKWDIKPLDKV